MTLPAIRKPVTLNARQSINDAFDSILRHNFDDMLQWIPVAYSREDIEGVHQVRVSLRRLRSAISIFRKAIPRTITDPWNEEMRWVASEFGPTRDLDVLITEGLEGVVGKIPIPEGEKKLLAIATQHQDTAYKRIRQLIDNDRYKTFVTNFDQWITVRGWFQVDMPSETRAYLGNEITLYAKKVLNKRLSIVLNAGASLESLSDPELHQLRIECKKLRYATEFFSALFDSKAMGEFTSQLKEVQGLLGILNDVAVMPPLLNTLLEGTQDVDLNSYAGALIGWRSYQAADIRKQLVTPWKYFSRTAAPWSKR
ncbi:CHAD domain-containing protein [Candidatus Magnetaquicoccus inordinatus]|uniref:CHAD domain-containing protein n=1 Tax=Candidatus Magnetaquicoccus inordinatus TaxID=2496818 RepID=UPI00102AB9C1|nr:CHAD domain-containing protein [Candidatus Magnetaquicoccus inordinatus]